MIKAEKCPMCDGFPQLAGETSFCLHCCGLDTFHYSTQDGATLAWNEAVKGYKCCEKAFLDALAKHRHKATQSSM